MTNEGKMDREVEKSTDTEMTLDGLTQFLTSAENDYLIPGE